MDLNNIDEKQFNVAQEIDTHGNIKITLLPKVRKCLCCNSTFEATPSDYKVWKDDSGIWRKGHFCRYHMPIINTILKERLV